MPKNTLLDGSGGCDPARDPRGRLFVIYDVVTGAIAQYESGVHGCGGA